jgi:hypothetical protein
MSFETSTLPVPFSLRMAWNSPAGVGALLSGCSGLLGPVALYFSLTNIGWSINSGLGKVAEKVDSSNRAMNGLATLGDAIKKGLKQHMSDGKSGG